jgi:hypothetical protein
MVSCEILPPHDPRVAPLLADEHDRHDPRRLVYREQHAIRAKQRMIARSEPFILGTNLPVYSSWEGEGELTFRRGR